MLGRSRGTNRPGDPLSWVRAGDGDRSPFPSWKTTQSTFHLPALDLPPPSPTSLLPSSFLSPEPPAPQSSPSSPRCRHAWLRLGSCWRGHSPACPACRAPRGPRGGLGVPKGEEEGREHPRAEQWRQGSVLMAMSPAATLPTTSHPGVPTGDLVGLSFPLVTWWGSASRW